MALPKGYAVVLTERGQEVVQSVYNTNKIGTALADAQAQQLLANAATRVKELIAQQKALEARIGDKMLQEIYNQYAITSPTTLKLMAEGLKDELKGLDDAEKKYSTSIKLFNKAIDKQRQIVVDIMEILSNFNAAGQSIDAEAAVIHMKDYLKRTENAITSWDAIENEILASQEEVIEHGKEITQFTDSIQQLTKQKLDGGTFTIAPTGAEGEIAVSGGTEEANKAMRDYFELLYKKSYKKQDDVEKNLERLRHKKYTTYGSKDSSNKSSKQGAVRSKLVALRDALQAGITTVEKNKNAALEIAQNSIPGLIDSFIKMLETGQPQTTSVKMGNAAAGIRGGGVEGAHVEISAAELKKLQDEAMSSGWRSIQYNNTGTSRTREVYTTANVTVKYDITPFSHDKATKEYLDLNNGEFPEQLEVPKVATLYEPNKIDNLFSLTSDSGDVIHIAFSDKFYKARNLQNIALIGDANYTNKEMETAPVSLLNNIDLFAAANDDLVEQLVFALLNMSSASYLHDQYNSIENIQKIVEQMVSTYILEIAFNVQDFVAGLENQVTKKNTLCVFNFSDALFVKMSEVLEGVLKQLQNAESVREIVSVQVQADTTHQSIPLWMASLKQEPDNQKARWTWVAHQVAENTKIGVRLNVQNLFQLFLE